MIERRWLLGVGAILGIGSCNGSSWQPTWLQFTRTADGTVVSKTQALNGTVWTPADSDLAAARATCVDELTMKLDAVALVGSRVSDPPRTEIDLYARSPNEMAAFMSNLDDAAVQRGLSSFPKSDTTNWNPSAAVPGGFPNTLVAAWPSAIGAATGPTTMLALSTTAFFGPHFGPGLPADVDFCHPGGDAGSIQPGASLKSAVLFNRGTCHQEKSLDEVIQPGARQLASALHDKRQLGIGRVTISYAVLQSYLRTGAGLDAPAGGIFLFLHYIAADLLGNSGSDVVGAVRYDFELDGNGVLGLVPHELRWDYGGVWGPLSSEGALGQPGWHGALTRSDGAMVQVINQQIRQKQLLGEANALVGLGLASNYACDDSSFATKCGEAASWLAQGFRPSVKARGKFSEAEIDHLMCALGDAASCAKTGADAAAILKQRWVCTTSTRSPSARYCDMTVPIKRIVATPDSIDAVFFDGDEVDSAAYALQAATSGVCDQDAPLPASRAFVSVVTRD